MGISFAADAEIVRYQSFAALLCFLGMTTHSVCLTGHAVCLLDSTGHAVFLLALTAHAVSAAAVHAFKAQCCYCVISKTTLPA